VCSRAAAGDHDVCGRGGQGDHGPARSTRPQLSATNIATTAALDLLGQELRHDEVVKERLRAALCCVDDDAEAIKPTRRLLVLGPTSPFTPSVRTMGASGEATHSTRSSFSSPWGRTASRGLRRVEAVGHSEVLRRLAKRNTDIGNHRTRLVCRMHALLAELAGGGIAKEINASDVDRFLAALTPATPVEQTRGHLAVELLDDIRRLDTQLKASHKRIRDAGQASGSTVTDLFGVGPILAAMLIGYSGDIARFRNRDRYAA
jgi:hypothetical protein